MKSRMVVELIICGGGIKGGIEGGIHAVRQILEHDETEGCLLIDAGNAFNALAREATLWNCRIMWPSGSRFLFNTYRGYARIFINGTDEIILSKEGSTQGDPLAMPMYGVGVVPLAREVKRKEVKQNWYADDSIGLGKLRALFMWFFDLLNKGPKSGYFPEPSKCFVVVKEGYEDLAKDFFLTLMLKLFLLLNFWEDL